MLISSKPWAMLFRTDPAQQYSQSKKGDENMTNTETVETKKVTDLAENATVTDEDLFIVGSDGSAALRKVKWKNIITNIGDAMKAKIAEWLFADLNTTDKTITGAINELNKKVSDLTGNTLRFANGVQIYFLQMNQLTDKDLVGYYKYFNFDLPFRDNLYCVQITNNTNNERVYVDNRHLTTDQVLIRCDNANVWVYVMCIGYWK